MRRLLIAPGLALLLTIQSPVPAASPSVWASDPGEAENCWESLEGLVFNYESPLELREPPKLSRLDCSYNNQDEELRKPGDPILSLNIGVMFAPPDLPRADIDAMSQSEEGFCSDDPVATDPKARNPDLPMVVYDFYPLDSHVVRAWFGVSDRSLFGRGHEAARRLAILLSESDVIARCQTGPGATLSPEREAQVRSTVRSSPMMAILFDMFAQGEESSGGASFDRIRQWVSVFVTLWLIQEAGLAAREGTDLE